eukprot:15868939-Heterocapsa_arctica.AAC.1
MVRDLHWVPAGVPLWSHFRQFAGELLIPPEADHGPLGELGVSPVSLRECFRPRLLLNRPWPLRPAVFPLARVITRKCLR